MKRLRIPSIKPGPRRTEPAGRHRGKGRKLASNPGRHRQHPKAIPPWSERDDETGRHHGRTEYTGRHRENEYEGRHRAGKPKPPARKKVTGPYGQRVTPSDDRGGPIGFRKPLGHVFFR